MDGDKTLAQQFAEHLTECLDVRRETNRKLDGLGGRFDSLNKTAWRAVGAIALVVFTAMVAVMVQASGGQHTVAQSTAATVLNSNSDNAKILAKLRKIMPD